MSSQSAPWHSRVRVWLNSIHVHMFALSMAVIISLTALSLGILALIDLPADGRPIRVYEIARLLEGRPLASSPGDLVYSRQHNPPQGSKTALERILTRQLAMRLGKPEADIRMHLLREAGRTEGVKREIELYGPDGAADPVVRSTFTAGVRDGAAWKVITRPTSDTAWRPTLWYALIFGFLTILPLTIWFSGRFSRPIKVFAASAQRMRANQTVEPIKLAGPSEIRLAAQSLNEMQARVSRYVQERTTLTGAIAHDLRAPLSRLHFHLAAVPDTVRKAAEEDIREMERMIETILEFVEHEARPSTREPIELSMLVEGVADDFVDLGRDVRVTATQPITAHGDPMLLKRLLINLVENAVNYGRAARVVITQHGADAVIQVSDDGDGMKEDELVRAFEPFFRGEPSRNRRTGGVGLGLSIVKSAAEAHGGTVMLANSESGGLTATVVLPLGNPG